ncbi:hypothetical protein GCM10007933_11040 [Zoogloea oryzae]|uniref:DUF6752 domain-containing protein n=1 Tax=Zoogloea oryzae TaxID=310767 RepID=A0ABQ6F7W2_9RHOO|nr:DUF6752 domain-containing protein [Zoogloea oryzae]GLT21652.1 hypothetical protein GCM10007933_11040 [Zoogloea oryzae]
MADIDLIPASWRAEQRARRTLRGGLVAVGCAIAAVAAVRIGLEITNRQATTALQTLQAQRRDSERIVARLTALNARVDEARELSRKIAALRGTDVVGGVLVPIDQALGESVWFDELIYTRIPALPQPGTPIAPADASLAIHGKAPDPATIGAFAEALGSAGPCAKPRLVPGNVKQYNRFELMEFALNCPLTLRGGDKS